MNRVLVTSLVATATGVMLVFVAHGCTLNPFGDYTFEEAEKELTGAASSSGGLGGAGGGTGGTGGTAGCVCGAADNNPCTDDLMEQACPGTDEKSCHAVVVARPCTATGGKAGVCDAAGVCIACSDCSDASCTNRCIGQACGAGADCANGKCVDGYCCDSDCTGPCNSCKRVPGICSPLPVGMTSDVAGDCSGGDVCGNAGTCITPQNGALGTLCGLDSACESGECVGQICVSLNDQPCVEDLECGSRLCDPSTHKCIACGGAVPCPGGATCLADKSCAAQLGQPATKKDECQAGDLIAPDPLICTLGMGLACTNNNQCASHDCNAGTPTGTCAKPCTIDGECEMPLTCNKQKGYCFLPPGSLCVVDDQCQGSMGVGKCAGFPPRCQ